MTKSNPAGAAPRLPATSVDFNALNAACARGEDAAAKFADDAQRRHRERINGKPKTKAGPAPTAPAPDAPAA